VRDAPVALPRQRTVVRTLAAAQFTNSLGDGAYYVTSILFFTSVVGLSPTGVGLGLSCAWTLGFLSATPIGHLADRWGLRGTAVTLAVVTAAGLGLLIATRSMAGFVAAASVYAVAQSGLSAVRQALLVSLVDEAERVMARARLQVMLNSGLGLGAALGGLALWSGATAAYIAVLAGDAITFVLAGLMLARLPATTRIRTGTAWGGSLAVLRDRPFVVATALSSLLYLYMPVLSVLLPLWIADRTEAPEWVVGVVFVLNTLGVVTMQSRAARHVTGLLTAASSITHGGALLGAACLTLAASALVDSATAATAILLLGALVLVTGEVLVAAGCWEVGFAMADPGRPGQWQGFFSSGIPIARAAGPVILLALVMGWTTLGWLVLGSGFLISGLALAAVTRRADQARLGSTNGVASGRRR
jgi:MFS family permease